MKPSPTTPRPYRSAGLRHGVVSNPAPATDRSAGLRHGVVAAGATSSFRAPRSTFPALLASLILCSLTLPIEAQRYRSERRAPDPRGGAPDWQINPQFKHDVFTFVRIVYDSDWSRSRRGWRGGAGWDTDHPDADLNFSFRLQQLTSMQVDPKGRELRLTDPTLFDYPFIYIVEPGSLRFSEAEVQALRRYLLSGGFLMVDDFWGVSEYDNFYQEIKRVLPDREPRELPLEHSIFNCVFKLDEKPQIPNVGLGTQSHWPGHPNYGRTWEDLDDREPHYRAIEDDQGRIMVLICHNTDLGDGWEREGENEIYFREFSEKWAYPLGINIIFYAMTH